MNVREAIARLVAGHDLTQDEAREAMRSLTQGEATPAQIAGFIVALRMKGETAEEIAGLAEAMRDAALAVRADGDVVDVVGTGGDGAGTFNISTISAFVVASAGGAVAKHGNRSITSACGAADFLEALGVAIDLPPDGVARCIRETGFGFMFAPLYHPAMRYAIGPRGEIGVRTVYNILGPLTNPARARRQLTGVAVGELREVLADVLRLMGSAHALVVHGDDGLDEISLSAPTQVTETRDGSLYSFTLDPGQFGLPFAPPEAVRGGTAETNVAMAREVLAGAAGAPRSVVLLNAGAALYVAGLASSIAEGVERAAHELDSGRARDRVDLIIAVSQRIKQETASVEALP